MDIIDPILAIANTLYSLCGEVKANKERCHRLALRVEALVVLVKAVKETGLGQNPGLVENGLRDFKITLECALDMIKKYACANFLMRIVKAYDQGDEFGSLNERLNEAAQVFSLTLQVDQGAKLQEVFQEVTRRTQDEADIESDRLELQKLLQSLAEEKKSLDAVHEIVDSTQKEVRDIKNMVESLKKPCILFQDIREIQPEELSYDVPIEPIFKSANSEVFRGEYNKFTVAIKRYTCPISTGPSQVRSVFQREVDTMKRFESPNILRMFGICVQDENVPNPNYLIVMEYCEKGSLRNVLDSQRKLSWERKARMSLDAAKGLYRLHQSDKQQFKVHGCINSSRFLVADGYRVKLGDLELAKTETSLMRTKDRKNSSLCYTSPQQLDNINQPYTKACEMYSFGIVLWEIATRNNPFKDCSTRREIYQRVCIDQLTEPLPKDCPKKLGELINACRSYEGFHRPTAGVLVDKLRKVVEQMEED